MTWRTLLCFCLSGTAFLASCHPEEPTRPKPPEADGQEANGDELAGEDGTDAGGEAGDEAAAQASDEPSVEETLALDAVRQHLTESATSEAGPLRFAVVERGPHQPWVMGVVNQGEQPALLVADPRLVAFDVKVPGKHRTTRCELPEALRPHRAQRRYRVLLAPGEGVVKVFDPRLYCFAASGQRVLVPGAIVTPHFGWPEKVKTIWKGGKKQTVVVEQQAPFVARILDDSTTLSPPPTMGTEASTDDEDEAEAPAIADAPQARGVKELKASSIALDSAYKDWSAVGLRRERQTRSPIVIDMQQGSDAHSQLTATVAITLKNRSRRTQNVYFRRELLSFEVMGPGGSTSCDPQPDSRSPDRQAFLTLGAGRSMTITSRLVELCPKGTFTRPGFYLVHARFHTDADGEDFGLDAYVGTVASETPANVRIRTGELDPRERQAMRPLVVLETP